MKLDNKELQLRDRLSELADEAGGLLAGSETTIWTEASLKGMDLQAIREESDRILDEVGVQRSRKTQTTVVVATTTISYADKLALLTERLTQGANLVLIAARNIENLPEETVNTLYDQLIELDQRAGSRK